MPQKIFAAIFVLLLIVHDWGSSRNNFSSFDLCVFMYAFSGMPLAQAISILQKHCRIIKNVQVLYSEQVSYVNVNQILTIPF